MLRGSSKQQKKTKHDNVIDESAIEKMYSNYTDEEDPDVITMDGISKLSDDLGLDPSTDVRVLVLLWRLGKCTHFTL